ncbi:hypothetical protein PV326_011817 [Microctonus aethiopoides]|nr:hypothetical protein PV326_011817 [Microctonus aethiopoides]
MYIFNVRDIFGRIYNHCTAIPLPTINLSRSQKIFVVCLTGSTLLLGGLAKYLKRRRRPPYPHIRRQTLRQRYISGKGSNFDAVSQVSWAKRSEASTRSHVSDRMSLASSIPGGLDGDVKLTPQQYGVLVNVEILQNIL